MYMRRVQVAQVLPQRTYNAVATRLTRITASVKRGPWTADEDRELQQRYSAVGSKWAEIGRAIGRSGQSCRDRWRVTGLVPGRNTGVWSEAECNTLVKIVTGMVRAPQACGCRTPAALRHLCERCHGHGVYVCAV